MGNKPNHVAVIPDGNRRWAKKKGLPSLAGHQEGTVALEKIIGKSLELEIPCLTIWGTSLDNITKRSREEVSYLFKIFEEQFRRMIDNKDIYEKEVKVQILGRWKGMFPKSTQKVFDEIIDKTKNHGKSFLTFLMAYNGTDEMIECIKNIKESGVDINEKTIKSNLWSKELPAVDLVIRTGCEDNPHLSAGFMMWDTAYSQLYFTNKYFPEFREKEFEEAIEDYSRRERREGA